MTKLKKHSVVYVPVEFNKANHFVEDWEGNRPVPVEPKENVYVLTESELKKLLGDWIFYPDDDTTIDEFIKEI